MASHTQVVSDVHIMTKGNQLLNGAHMTAIGGGVQGSELVHVPAVHFVLELPNKQINELHPALLRCYMHWCSALFRVEPGRAAQLTELTHCSRPVPGCCAVQRSAAVSIFCSRISPLQATVEAVSVCEHTTQCRGVQPSLFFASGSDPCRT